MPSTNQSSSPRDLPEFPRIEEELGYNPARYLDWRLVGAGSEDSDVGNGRLMLLKAKVRGIDRLEAVRAFEAVERNPRVGEEDGARSGVIQLLHQREDQLRERGERPDRLPYGPREPCECCSDEPTHTAESARETRRKEREALVSGRTTSSVDTDKTSPQTETASLGDFGSDDGGEAVATDGGEDQ